jgi:hypothetical protein
MTIGVGISTVNLGATPTPSNAVTGAYLLVASDPGVTNGRPPGTLNGRIFRLGTDTSGDGTVFQLQPGMDINNSNNDNYEVGATGGNLTCFIIGRAPTLTGTPSSNPPNYMYTGNFTGPNQDIAAMSALISVNTATN